MGKTVGIIAAKGNSNRFPGKNTFRLGGIPMFWHSVQPLIDCKKVDKVYVATDSPEIVDYCRARSVEVVTRGRNATYDDEPLIGVLTYSYKTLPESYEYLITIMANCPGHSADDVKRAIELIETNKYNEVRGFNDSGEETGLLVFKTAILLQTLQISSHIACVSTNAREIHYRHELPS